MRDIPPDMHHLVVGYHGTDAAYLESIQKDGFRRGTRPSWFGRAVYFWEQDRSKAIWWSKDYKKYGNPIVIASQIDLSDNCLDLTTDEGIDDYKQAVEEIFKKDHVKGMFQEFLKKYPNLPDAFCLNLICEALGYYSIRALVMKGASAYQNPVASFRNKFTTAPSKVVTNAVLVLAIINNTAIKKAVQVWP